jgi:GT2 family glycosyltransferase
MKLAVAIPTFGRRAQVEQLVGYLARQNRLPDEVVVSAPDPSHVSLPDGMPFPVRAVYGPPGLCTQRNTALDELAHRYDIISFLDDDFVPAADYFAGVTADFAARQDFAVVMGRVILDGATNEGVTWTDAQAALDAPDRWQGPDIVDHVGAYGCNMSIRTSAIGDVRFDERLVLYGWQEDIDFSCQLRRRGRVVCVPRLRGVHLGIKSGRVSGMRFGYSQVVNPIYLIRKGTVPPSFALPLMLRNLAANLVKSLKPEAYIDRRGRLRGNALAIAHVLRGRVEPERILDL